MMILGWNKKYSTILKELNYSRKKDKESAVILDSILKKHILLKKLKILSKMKQFL